MHANLVGLHFGRARYTFFFFKQETSEKEKKKQFPFTATSRGDVALLSANRVWAAGLVHSAKPGFAQKH